MLPGSQKKCNIWGAIALTGILGGIAINILYHHEPRISDYGAILLLIGWIAWMVGCCVYAQAKGYSVVAGFLSLLGVIGLIILLALPDKHPTKKPFDSPEAEPGEVVEAA